MIKINYSKFITSAVQPDQFPDDNLPEIALVGRSNVGKSSMINKIINRKNLARTSSSPGKTQTINFYQIDHQWYFVDLPGYGYAKVSHVDRERWRKFIEIYLTTRPNLKAIWQLVDLRHKPTAQDVQMFEWIRHYQVPFLLLATKADKLSKNQVTKNASVVRKTLGLNEDQLIIFSAETGQGKDKILGAIEKLIKE